jgi:hypothetical protein
METFYFMLGGLTVLTFVCVVGLVSMLKQIKTLSLEKDQLWNAIDNLNRDLGTDIERVHNHVNEAINDMNIRIDVTDRELNDQLFEVNRSIDSRLDKLENRLINMYNEGCKPVKEKQ